MSSDPNTLLGIPANLIVQGTIGFLVFFWAWREARKTYQETKQQLQPNPVVAGISMAWDRDQQERFLQLIERMAKAAEEQAAIQHKMSGSWAAMSDRQREDMDKKIERLLEALDHVERKDVLAMIAAATGR